MKTKATKLLALLLAGLMLGSSLVACGVSSDNGDDSQKSTVAGETNEDDTKAPADAAIEAIGDVDFGGEDFGILYAEGFKQEIENEKEAAEGQDLTISEAVHERNTTLEEKCNLTLTFVPKASPADAARTEASAPTGEFFLIDASLRDTATTLAVNGYLSDWVDMGVNLEGEWWDSGTADFRLNDGVYFMCGSNNFMDDNFTYALIFNKGMQKTYENTVPNPYDTVREKKWTLSHFYEIIQGVSKESSGNGQWDELDTYGFAVTWEFGNTFFIGCDLRYVLNDETIDTPELFLTGGRKDKALEVLDLACSIFHDNNASYAIPGGEEAKGLAAFKEDRAMFYSEIVTYLRTLNAEMEGDYGVLPIPKYDEAQEFYRTWTHDSGSTFSVTSAVPADKKEVIGDIVELYALLSHKIVKTAYYDTVLTSRDLRDPDSAEMMDILFANRVYDMGFYFVQQFGFYELFKSCVNDNSTAFISKYDSVSRTFGKKVENLLEKMNKD